MTRKILAVAALGLLVGCGDGNPFTFGATGPGGTPSPPPTVPGATGTPEALSVNLFAFSYNPAGAGTLTLDVRSGDSVILDAPYNRVPGRDIAGYRAFEYQQDANTRKFLAFVATAASGSVTATSIADGGKSNAYFGGAQYQQETPYSAPATGLVTYAGAYAGVITVDTSGNTITEPSIYPYQPSVVQGEALITGDFTNGSVEGAIYNRIIIAEDGVTVLPGPAGNTLVDLALRPTALAADGSFQGAVEEDGAVGSSYGTYGGTFGGIGSTDVAGVVFLTPYGGPGIWEHGIFVLPTCAPACPTP